MKVRQHVWVLGRCKICGADEISIVAERHNTTADKPDERTCLERDDYQSGLCPEPTRRMFAHEDADFIAQRIAQIREDAKPKCKLNGSTLLSACLRSTSKCSDTCPDRDDWTGPEKAEEAGAFC